MVTIITLTFNRHTLLERVCRCILDQDYEGEINWIIYNTGHPVELGIFDVPKNRHIYLINNTINKETGREYSSVGEKYNDALKHVPKDTEWIIFHDDDDLMLPSRVRIGVEGIKKYEVKGYKTYHSYFLFDGKCTLEHNVFEGSFILGWQFIKDVKFPSNNVRYHDCWIGPLIQQNQIKVDENGIPCFIYDWNTPTPVHKMSGLEDNDLNFVLSKSRSRDFGDGLITPCPPIDYKKLTQLHKG